MNYLRALQTKRDDVWRELDGLRRDRRELDEKIAIKEGQLKNLDELLALEGGSVSPNVVDDVARSTPPSFLDVAAELLQDSESGVHYQALLSALNEKGVNVPGREPGANLIAHLTRDERFVRTGRGMYGLRGRHTAIAPKTVRTRTSRGRKARAR